MKPDSGFRPVIPARSDNAQTGRMGTSDLIGSFDNYLRSEKGASDNTCKSYKSDLEQFAEWLRRRRTSLFETSRTQIQKYLAEMLAKGTSPRSVGRKLATMRTFYGFLVSDEVIKFNPARLVPTPKVGRPLPKALSTAELDKMVRSIRGRSALALRDRAILLTAFAAGLRVSELTRLVLADLDLEAGAAKVWKGKGGNDGIVPLSPKAISALRTYISRARPKLANGKNAPFVFLTHAGQGMTRQRAWQLITAIGSAALGKHISPHYLRHGFATALVEGGADIRDVQALCRHADINTTQIYVHTDMTYLRRIYDETHPRA